MNRDEWAAALIAAMGWSMGVRDGIVAQAYSEGSRALRNPLDTTEPWPGSWPYNSAGVQNYASTQDGIAATKVTLQNGYYNAVLSAGRVGDATAYVRAVAGSPWGTWSNTRDADNALAIVRGDPSIGLVEVVGTAPDSPPPEAEMTYDPDTKQLHAVVVVNGQVLHYWQDTRQGADNSWHHETLPQ